MVIQNDIYEQITYSQRLADSLAWVRMADELLVASKVLEREVVEYWRVYNSCFESNLPLPVPPLPNVQAAYFLLVAYALENLCKANLVSIHQNQLRNRLLKKLPSYIKSHDLLQLVKAIGLDITLEEEDLLVRLSRNAVWSGRYPVPINPSAQAAMRQFSDGNAYLIAFFHGGDVQRINDLTAKIKDHIDVSESYEPGT